MKEKGSHYLEPSSVVYPNQEFLTSGNGDKVKPEINKIVNEDNKEVLKEGFFWNQSAIENNLNKSSSTFQRQKLKRNWEVKSLKSTVVKQTNETVFQ